MCQNTGGDGNPVIYSVPTSIVEHMRKTLTTDPVASSISFTDNGSLYVSGLYPPSGTGRSLDTDGHTVSVLGCSGTGGSITAVNVEKIAIDSSKAAISGAHELSFVFNLTAPLVGKVQFSFDVNPSSVVVNSVTPVIDDIPVAAAAGLNLSTVWCITKSGGSAILPALVSALPSLAAGPEAYLAAVVAAMPGAAISTVQSIISNCFG